MRLRAKRRSPETRRTWLGAIWLAAVLAAGPVTPAAAQPLPGGAENCLAALTEAQSNAGANDEQLYYVTDYCPEFGAALRSSAWSANLPIDSDFIGPSTVSTLIETAAHYDTAASATLSIDRLDAIVAELEPFVAEPEPTIWQRIGDWIRGWLEGSDGEQTWLGRWLSTLTIPDSWVKPIMYSIAALAVLAVLAIVINELRLGGAFVGRTTRALRSAAAGRSAPDLPPPTIDSIHAEPSLGRRIELTLALVVHRMRQHIDGLSRASLTHRELAGAAGGLDATAREEFGHVASAAERVTYADWEPDEQAAQRVLASGEALIRRFENDDGASA